MGFFPNPPPKGCFSTKSHRVSIFMENRGKHDFAYVRMYRGQLGSTAEKKSEGEFVMSFWFRNGKKAAPKKHALFWFGAPVVMLEFPPKVFKTLQ